VTLSGLIGLIFIFIFFGLIVISAAAGRSQPGANLREITAFVTLRRAVGLAVEAGSRLHISIGRGKITSPESASAFVGLSMLGRMARSASTGDRPPVITTGDAALTILAQDTMKSSFQDLGLIEQFDSTASQLSGVTPFSYAAGALMVARDKKSSTSIMIGNFGPEVALLTDGSERGGNLTLAGTDNLSAQAILYATANDPIIGEELFAGGAYVQAGPFHTASLRAQDVIRWLLVAVIIIGVVLKALGIDQAVMNALGGIL